MGIEHEDEGDVSLLADQLQERERVRGEIEETWYTHVDLRVSV